MLFFCKDDVQVEIACFLDGKPFASQQPPSVGAHWRYTQTDHTADPRPQHLSAASGDAMQNSDIESTGQFAVTDPFTGLVYNVQTAVLAPSAAGQRDVYHSFPDGLPPYGRDLLVTTVDRSATRRELEPINAADLICFCRGTMIRTPSGDVPVEMLMVGDMVTTHDNGAQTIRWIGSRTVAAEGPYAPIAFEQGAVGNDTRLRVSPRHRMLIERDNTHVLITAQDLANGKTIYTDPGGKVEYFHLIFDRHEVVFANGAPTESFHPLLECADTSADGTRGEILTMFPDMITDPDAFDDTAYPVIDIEDNYLVAGG